MAQKSTSGARAGTELDCELRARRIDAVVITGVATDIGVTGFAREPADPDFDVLLVTDACPSPNEVGHHDALKSLGSTFTSLFTNAILARFVETSG